jgi:hypothetical protein
MIPLDVRQRLWAWYYGMRAFQHSKACCDHILKEAMTSDHPLYYSLNVAAHISYGKPFRHSRGIQGLDDAIIPARYRRVHQQILDFRDKHYAHTDVEGNPHPTGDLSVDVLYCFDGIKRGFKLCETTVLPDGIKNLAPLCELLAEKATYHLGKILNQYRKEFPQAIGHHRIGVRPNDLPFTQIPDSEVAGWELQ